ncbi:MAG: hypothetical protein B6U77_01005 [Candidatus Hecatellales archaeon ex4484_218]|nr:MAG: hypothetical protein B6U77_01005 [Candidatus Hecatellales archaeon ex4484_218]
MTVEGRFIVKGEKIKPVTFKSLEEAERFVNKLREAGIGEAVIEEVKEAIYPVAEGVKVVKGETIYKTPTWWMAVLLTERFKRREVAVYRWKKKGEKWSRKQKLSILNRKHWEKIKQIVDSLLEELEKLGVVEKEEKQ